jgi:hypothetical protein
LTWLLLMLLLRRRLRRRRLLLLLLSLVILCHYRSTHVSLWTQALSALLRLRPETTTEVEVQQIVRVCAERRCVRMGDIMCFAC